MKHSRFLQTILATFLFGSVVSTVQAGPDLSKTVVTQTAAFSPFEKGRHELEFTGGWFYSPILMRSHRPEFDYAQQNIRFGWMLTSPSGNGFFRGNYELLANVTASEITAGPGSWMAGARLLIRYNFIQPNAHLVPFITLGGGGIGDDAYLAQWQRLIGSGFEFTLTASGGVRYFIQDNWALQFAVTFEHISNAGTADRNWGSNALGGELGVSRFF